MNGIILINKPIGISSYHALSQVKRFFATKKVGHCGTLDPFADGLLIACVNQATKIAGYIEDEEKEYIATLRLGNQTNSGDIEGQVIKSMPIPSLSKEQIELIFQTFIGQQLQMPPMFSAIKINGQKLYELARKGETIERIARPIWIKSIDLLRIEDNEIMFNVVCSKGTYIRTLGEDIAEKLGTVGHLIRLTRTRIGNFKLENAVLSNELTDQKIISISDALPNIPHYIITNEIKAKIFNGIALKLPYDDDIILLIDETNQALALYHKQGEEYICVRGLW